MEITKLFDNILDLPGIEGVCLFGTEGQVYVNRLPAFLSNELFADAQRRIVAMYETMDENFLPSDDYMLRFSERWLLLRRTENQVLLVLGGDKANLASTRMVTNMTIKHLTPAVMEQLSATAKGSFTVPAKAAPVITPATAPGAAVAAPASKLPAAPAAAPASAPAPVPALATSDEQHKAPVRMYRGRAY
jgi:hypothetical protein